MSLVYISAFIALVALVDAQLLNLSSTHPIREALFLNNASAFNNTRDKCVWRPATQNSAACPDQDINFILYAESNRELVDLRETDWLRQSSWNSTKENVIIIHGYAGGDDTLPIAVLRDAYINNGNYNVWMLDWGPLCQPPCYAAAVHNMRAVAKCAGEFLTLMRSSGMSPSRTVCVGHSLGAHICGLISHHVLFRLHRIIGLDPARPLVPVQARLSPGDAAAVHALHTNAGHYGEMGRSGHVDFCINGGKTQPYCQATENESLCSHVWAICYMAESLHGELTRKAEPCSRRCPSGSRPGHRIGIPIPMGQSTPLTTSGSYCVHDERPPYCPSHPGAPGDKRCCIT
ncbi:phospholipase A1 member A-like [Photinus pyralis]|uniref:phospholipase A1 member A-like n=1 Tax=Photinus pyralis TaxID=7054 RepID=UPI001266F0D0|nr:phospholipase A1 member A-like [Photinus pyralis]